MNADQTIFSDQHKANISKAMRGKVKTPEHKAKLAAAARLRWAKKKLNQSETEE